MRSHHFAGSCYSPPQWEKSHLVFVAAAAAAVRTTGQDSWHFHGDPKTQRGNPKNLVGISSEHRDAE